MKKGASAALGAICYGVRRTVHDKPDFVEELTDQDVMDPEPLPKDHPLWTAPRVYITPHMSGGYRAGVNYDRVIDVAVKNLTLAAEGKPPVHTVDRALGY